MLRVIAPYLAALKGDTEKRPLAEQIVDQLLAEDETRYRMYEELRAARDKEGTAWTPGVEDVTPAAHEAIGAFLSRWIELERLLREIVAQRSLDSTGKYAVAIPTPRVLESLEISNRAVRMEIDRIRR